MHVGHRRHGRREDVGHDRQAVSLGQRRHFAADGDPSGPDDIGLDDVDRTLGDEVAEAGETGRRLVAGHRHVERCATSALPATSSVATGSSSQ